MIEPMSNDEENNVQWNSWVKILLIFNGNVTCSDFNFRKKERGLPPEYCSELFSQTIACLAFVKTI